MKNWLARVVSWLIETFARAIAADPAPTPAAATPAVSVPAITVSQATDGLVALGKICTYARAAIASKGGNLAADEALTLAVLDEAAQLIPLPQVQELDEAAHVAAALIPVLIALRRANPMNNPVVDAQASPPAQNHGHWK